MKAVKDTWGNLTADTKVTVRNIVRLIESVALLVTAYYNYTTAYHAHISKFEYTVRVVSSVVIGLMGAYYFLCHMANKEAK